MAQAKQGDTVRVHYTGELEDGSVFDSSAGRDPLEFQLGSGNVIPGFDRAVTGMAVGDKKTERIPCEDAYGERREEMMIDIPRTEVPAGMEISVGQGLRLQDSAGRAVPVVVAEVSDTAIKLDGNHPLAGKTLVFHLELTEIL